MWIRFWYSADGYKEYNWKWVSDKETESSLDELARDLVPDYIRYEHYYSKGWEKLTPPKDELEELKKEWQEKFDSAKFMLDIIEETMKNG